MPSKSIIKIKNYENKNGEQNSRDYQEDSSAKG